MSTLLSVVFGVLLLFVGGWTVVMGGIGLLLGPRRGRTRLRGFVYGFVLGPIGWALLCMTPAPYRRSREWTSGILERAPHRQIQDTATAVGPVVQEPATGWQARDELRF